MTPDEAEPTTTPADPGTAELVEDVLVEEVSIDGMCGVY
ncbi:MAG TPA: mycofactocin precursor MftA [Jatrophihabitans sp.]|jgi:mycofactocin precursor|nr:mycofactocin precursor MftA [Jatrophihabitans sp.]